MKQQTEVLTKILNVREQEKKEAQIAHHESMAFYEEISNELIAVLNKREIAEELYQKHLKTMTTIDKIREQTTYIEKINLQLAELQTKLHEARQHMHTKQKKLTSAHIEVKKFEKIIELRKYEQQQFIQKTEQMVMDEISIQQYVNRKLGE